MCYTDPARHPSLILIEALDLGQVSGRGALHLETLLGTKDSQRVRSCRYMEIKAITACNGKHSKPHCYCADASVSCNHRNCAVRFLHFILLFTMLGVMRFVTTVSQ